jgi:hypothetical protein
MVVRVSSEKVNRISSTSPGIASGRRRWGRAYGGGDDSGDTCWVYCLSLCLSLRTQKATVSNVEVVLTQLYVIVLFSRCPSPRGRDGVTQVRRADW